MVTFAKRLKRRLSRMIKGDTRTHSLPSVIYQSRYTNIYHCTVPKAASRWLRSILLDPRTYQYSGLEGIDFYQKIYNPRYGIETRPVHERVYTDEIPEGYIVTPLYMGYEGYRALQKPPQHRAFFIMRDPRDLVVSWYFSSRYSHAVIGILVDVRPKLESMSVSDGLLYSIDFCAERIFPAMASWVEEAVNDRSVLVLKFEDLTQPNNFHTMKNLFQHCDINIPTDVIQALLADYSFEKMAGRQRGKENIKSHYRKGVAGDWKNYFSDKHLSYYESVVGDLNSVLGYD